MDEDDLVIVSQQPLREVTLWVPSAMTNEVIKVIDNYVVIDVSQQPPADGAIPDNHLQVAFMATPEELAEIMGNIRHLCEQLEVSVIEGLAGVQQVNVAAMEVWPTDEPKKAN